MEIPNRDSLLSLDVISSFVAANYVFDIFFALCLSKMYEEHTASSIEMLHHMHLLLNRPYWMYDDENGSGDPREEGITDTFREDGRYEDDEYREVEKG